MQIIKELIDKGKKKGSLTYKEIMDELQSIELTPEQTVDVEKLLEKIEEDDDVQNVYHTMEENSDEEE